MSMSIPLKQEPWTVEDDDLPAEVRFEIVDGMLVVSPQPAFRHEIVVRGLVIALEQAVDARRIMAPFGVTFDLTNFRVPDVAVVKAGVDLWDAKRAGPDVLVLVAEIESPSSVQTDHVAKRAQYAAAGIPHYWIVETDPELRVTALALPEGGDLYVEVGAWTEGQTLTLAEPFPMSFEVSALRG